MTKDEVDIDHRVHSMIIGKGGREIRTLQQKFKVEIKLPREGDPNPDRVIVSMAVLVLLFASAFLAVNEYCDELYLPN